MKNIPKLVVLIGLSGSGKSTIAKQYAFTDNNREHIVVSSDAIRGELYGDENCQQDHAKVFEIAHNRLIQGLKDGYNMICDATNLSIKDRASLLNKVKNINCYVEACVINTPLEECIKRDSLRNRTVGREVIEKQVRKFQLPLVNEGFDNIELHNPEAFDLDTDYSEIISCMVDFNQQNKHHTQMLWEHSSSVSSGVQKYLDNIEKTRDLTKEEFNLSGGVWLHDAAKLWTGFFKEGDPNQHFYGHENVGAYWKLCNGWTLDEAFYENYHMILQNNIKEETKEKYKKLFGEERYNNLVLLRKIDRGEKE